MTNSENLESLKPGDKHYKAFVGPPLKYDLVGSMQFNLMSFYGMRDFHKVLDIGCGSLRLGKLLIPFLQKGNYFGIEPNEWLINDAFNYELGLDIKNIKSPKFSFNDNFDLIQFKEKFDFIIAQSIFSHASILQIVQCLNEVKNVLNKNGIFLATFVLGDEDYEGENWVYPECVTYSHKTILKIITENNLIGRKISWYHPNGQSWYLISNPENAVIFDLNKFYFRFLEKRFLKVFSKNDFR